jgi:D-glycero-alpha-D-manno-heptose-7-phosphate kinase
MVAWRAPTRIDFGGGWTDVPPYCDREGGCVCNIAITRHSSVRMVALDGTARAEVVTERDADRLLVDAALRHANVAEARVALHNDFPIGAGLGGSSAAGVALSAALAAWNGEQIDRAQIAERSREVEIRDLGVPGGRQDHYAAAFGGALTLRFTERVDVERLSISEGLRNELERRAMLVYTGQSRISGETITAVLGAYERGESRVKVALARMKELALSMADAIRASDVDALAALVGEHWAHQRMLHPSIPTERIDTIVENARRAGARGAKALGASGGGCVLVIAASDRVEAVREAIAPLGVLLPYSIDDEGVTQCA